MAVTVDVDTGGTFTDGFFAADGRTATAKVDTTPHDLTIGFEACLARGAEALGYADLASMLRDTKVVRFSTTAATNALIQRKGPRLGLLVAPGAERHLYGAEESPVFEFLVEPDMVAGVDPADPEGLRRAVDDLLARGARVLVVSLPGADLDPGPEHAVRAVIRAAYPRHFLGATPVLCSSDVSRRGPDDRRTHAAVVDAYLHPSAVRTLYRADERLRDAGARNPLLVAHAAGGAARVAKTVAIDTLNSGPACGALGARHMAELLGLDAVITLDIGGTSTDLAVLGRDRVPFDEDPLVHGVEVSTRQVAVESVGGGGGSIARATDGKVVVGPDSAGSVPGPACYGLGGALCTVTDANVVGGFVDPDYFLGGARRLDAELAADALDAGVAEPLGVEREEAVRRVRAALADIAAEEVRRLLDGGEAGDHALFAFGGGGGLHAAEIAERLGMRDVYLFPQASVFSAFGSSTLDVVHAYEEAVAGRPPAALAQELEEVARADMEVEGFDPAEAAVAIEVVRKGGEAIEVTDPLDVPGDAVLVRAVATVTVPHPALPVGEVTPSAATPKGERAVLGHDRLVYERADLSPGATLHGPAIVEADDTTYDVPAGWSLTVDERRIARLRREA
ncbi:MAG: hydantoinase/oxoprolinase family protein [Acidimicrobiia bacterium]|nr:hydantoinase/oxoprolinase family protein [Acidimicrobiia bacterium]